MLRALSAVLVLAIGAYAQSPVAAAESRPETGRVASRATSRPSRPPAPAASAYVRLEGSGDAERLETAWRDFRRQDGAVVRLVGAVHVADQKYYDALNRLLGAADLVLYEGVSGTPTADMTTIARLQLALGRVLDLTFQKDGVRYGRPHFVHADLPIEEIERRLKERGESLLPGGDVFKFFGPIFAKVMESAAHEAEAAKSRGEAPPFSGLKRMAARLLAKPDAARTAMSRAWDDVIVGERNAHVMTALAPLIEKPRGVVAIFYGAAHLPDFERRLVALGFTPEAPHWLAAWSLGAKAPPAEARKAASGGGR